MRPRAVVYCLCAGLALWLCFEYGSTVRWLITTEEAVDGDPCNLHVDSPPTHSLRGRVLGVDEGLQELAEQGFTVTDDDESVFNLHVVLLYDNVDLKSLCAAESAVMQMCAAAPDDNARRPARLWLWTLDVERFRREHRDVVEELERIAGDAARDVKIVLHKVDLVELFAETPLSTFAQVFAEADVEFPSQQRANAIRLAIIYKFGGMYMDADVLLLRDPSMLPNGMSKQDQNSYNNAVFKFNKGAPIVYMMMVDFVLHFDGLAWGANGPQLFTRIVTRMCSCRADDYPAMASRGRNVRALRGIAGHMPFGEAVGDTLAHGATLACSGGQGRLQMWPPLQIYPVPWDQTDVFCQSRDEAFERFPALAADNVQMVHYWNSALKKKECDQGLCQQGIARYSATFLGGLKAQLCPLVLKETMASKQC